MGRERKMPPRQLSGEERRAIITDLLATGIVRLALRQRGCRDRETTGLQGGSKRLSRPTQPLIRKVKNNG